jgi:oxidase EvaA
MDYRRNNNVELEFFKSALTRESGLMKIESVLQWLKEKNEKIKTNIFEKPVDKLEQWYFHAETGNILHKSGKFFSIEGIQVATNWGKISGWEQPIINQPEVGFLGILTKKMNGVLHFLMQAKIEPGNINVVQLSPTLQATKSNYSRIHKGKSPLYLEYFNGNKDVKVLIDQLQSEQGARFLKKRNRNIIVEIPANEDLTIYDNFLWLTLGQVKRLMAFDNVVNMDTRTVIAGIPFGSYSSGTLNFFTLLNDNASERVAINEHLLHSMLNGEEHFKDFVEIISWITGLKSKYELLVRSAPLKDLKEWYYNGMSIVHRDEKYFSVIGVTAQIESREVVSWDQPMIKPAQEGLVAFIVKKLNGIYHFLVQAKVEAGNFDIIELAPTVQCLTGNYRQGKNDYTVPFIHEVLNAQSCQIWYSARQSEEGGRFFREQNLNMIIEADDDFPTEVSENYCWMTLNQLIMFMQFNNYLNIAARSLIAAIVI